MYHAKILSLVFLALAYFDCGTASNNTGDVTSPPQNNSTPSVATPPQNISTPSGNETPANIPDDLMITLERGVCFGRCPQYTLTITSDGSVIFDGKKDTKVLGKAEGMVSREDLKRLVVQFDKIKFFQLEDRYDYNTCPVAATDAPSATVSLRLNGKAKTVYHYLGCVENNADHTSFPPGLLELEKMIDESTGSRRWTVNE